MKQFNLLLGALFFLSALHSQTLEADMQVRPRFEFRNGYKTLFSEGQDATSFVSQRSRLNLIYGEDNLYVKVSAQNIHVWGDVPINSPAERNGFGLFEAYGQYNLNSNLMFKLGRQVLSYDNQRILGEANWAQAGQRHDAALVTWKPATNHRLDIVAAYNSETETVVETPYLVNSYRNMQFAWYHIDVNNVGFSFLLLNTGYEFDTPLQEREVDYMQTYGAFHSFHSGSFFGDVSAYGQSGSRNGQEMSAWYGGLTLNYKISAGWNIGVGGEYFSGTEMGITSEENTSFTPLFGTNHAFNGYMDYFYTGNHLNSVGLIDLYGKLSYVSPRFEFSVIPHIFSSAATIRDTAGEEQDDYLGTEIDLSAAYKIRKDFGITFGYSQMFASESLEILKRGDTGRVQNWAWVMVNFSPKLFSFTKPEISAP